METWQETADARFDGIAAWQEKADTRFEHLEDGQREASQRFDRIDDNMADVKKILRHHTTLMIENFTDIRKDMRITNQETQADINLLFTEVEDIKRKTNKIEQKIKK